MKISYNGFEVRRDYMATNEKSRVTVAITAEMNENYEKKLKKGVYQYQLLLPWL